MVETSPDGERQRQIEVAVVDTSALVPRFDTPRSEQVGDGNVDDGVDGKGKNGR